MVGHFQILVGEMLKKTGEAIKVECSKTPHEEVLQIAIDVCAVGGQILEVRRQYRRSVVCLNVFQHY